MGDTKLEMESVLKALNQLVHDGVIEDYAIGGAIGASFYIDALQTEDVDAFTVLPGQRGGLISLESVYEALALLGGVAEREFVRFGEWPLQILTDANGLISEAIADAATVDYGGVPTRVFQSKHLCAVALQTGRAKDVLRVTMFLEQGAVDRRALDAVLARHGLLERAAMLLPSRFSREGGTDEEHT